MITSVTALPSCALRAPPTLCGPSGVACIDRWFACWDSESTHLQVTLTWCMKHCRTWCTLCNLALRHLSNCLPMFQKAFGANLIAISSQLPHHNFASELANQLSFPVLCDRGQLQTQPCAVYILYGMHGHHNARSRHVSQPSA